MSLEAFGLVNQLAKFELRALISDQARYGWLTSARGISSVSTQKDLFKRPTRALRRLLTSPDL